MEQKQVETPENSFNKTHEWDIANKNGYRK